MVDICYNWVVTTISWKDYITSKYLEWRSDKFGRRGSAASFAREIGITPQLLSDWMNKGQVVSDLTTINLLVSKFGFEVYDVLGFPGPSKSLEPFPPALRTALEDAIKKIIAGGFDADSPESQKIVDEAIIALGYKRISNFEHESSE